MDMFLSQRDERSMLAGEPSVAFVDKDYYKNDKQPDHLLVEWGRSGQDRRLLIEVLEDRIEFMHCSGPLDNTRFDEGEMEPHEINTHLHWVLDGDDK